MLHWKNKPIDQLSKQELQSALKDSVGMMLSNQGNNTSSDTFSIFLTGLSCGALVAVLGVFLTSMM